HAVPLRGVVRGGDHDAAGGAALADSEAQCRSRGDVVCERYVDSGGGDDLGARAREGFRSKAGVVADADAFCRIFLGVNVGGDCPCRGAHVGECEVVGDDAAPAIGSKLDLWMRHVEVSLSPCRSLNNRSPAALCACAFWSAPAPEHSDAEWGTTHGGCWSS